MKAVLQVSDIITDIAMPSKAKRLKSQKRLELVSPLNTARPHSSDNELASPNKSKIKIYDEEKSADFVTSSESLDRENEASPGPKTEDDHDELKVGQRSLTFDNSQEEIGEKQSTKKVSEAVDTVGENTIDRQSTTKKGLEHLKSRFAKRKITDKNLNRVKKTKIERLREENEARKKYKEQVYAFNGAFKMTRTTQLLLAGEMLDSFVLEIPLEQERKDDLSYYTHTGNSWNQSDIDERYYRFNPKQYPLPKDNKYYLAKLKKDGTSRRSDSSDPDKMSWSQDLDKQWNFTGKYQNKEKAYGKAETLIRLNEESSKAKVQITTERVDTASPRELNDRGDEKNYSMPDNKSQASYDIEDLANKASLLDLSNINIKAPQFYKNKGQKSKVMSEEYVLRSQNKLNQKIKSDEEKPIPEAEEEVDYN